MNRYNVNITDGDHTVYTFTWADDADAAQRRVDTELAEQPGLWAGYSATVDERPRATR